MTCSATEAVRHFDENDPLKDSTFRRQNFRRITAALIKSSSSYWSICESCVSVITCVAFDLLVRYTSLPLVNSIHSGRRLRRYCLLRVEWGSLISHVWHCFSINALYILHSTDSFNTFGSESSVRATISAVTIVSKGGGAGSADLSCLAARAESRRFK